jgi:hypothetical protein
MARGYDKTMCGNHGDGDASDASDGSSGSSAPDDDDGQVPLYCNRSTTQGQGAPAFCTREGGAKAPGGYAARVGDWRAISTNETEIAAALATGGGAGVVSGGGALAFSGGPLAIAMNAGPLQFYKRGIFTPGTGLFNKCDPKKLDHGVLIVGFGADAGDDYWAVKNSWGASWG